MTSGVLGKRQPSLGLNKKNVSQQDEGDNCRMESQMQGEQVDPDGKERDRKAAAMGAWGGHGACLGWCRQDAGPCLTAFPSPGRDYKHLLCLKSSNNPEST